MVNVPDRIEWAVLNQRFRDQGLVVGGAFGPLAGKVFRIGHMGVQANKALVDRGLNVIEEAIKQ